MSVRVSVNAEARAEEEETPPPMGMVPWTRHLKEMGLIGSGKKGRGRGRQRGQSSYRLN